MARRQSPYRIELTRQERVHLERMARAWAAQHRDVVRAQVILKVADGGTISGVAREVHVGRRIVRKWAERFVRKRLEGLEDEQGRGRPARFSP